MAEAAASEPLGQSRQEAAWVETLRGDCEPEHHWRHRREFLLHNAGGSPAGDSGALQRLVSLSMVWANHVFLGCRYPLSVMEKVLEMAEGIKVTDAPAHTTRDELVAKVKKRGISSSNEGVEEPCKKRAVDKSRDSKDVGNDAKLTKTEVSKETESMLPKKEEKDVGKDSEHSLSSSISNQEKNAVPGTGTETKAANYETTTKHNSTASPASSGTESKMNYNSSMETKHEKKSTLPGAPPPAATKSSSQASAPPPAATKSSSQASAPPAAATNSSSQASAPPAPAAATKSSSQASAPPTAAAATKSSSQASALPAAATKSSSAASAPPAAAAATKSSSQASAPPRASKSSSLASAPPVASKSSSQASAPPPPATTKSSAPASAAVATNSSSQASAPPAPAVATKSSSQASGPPAAATKSSSAASAPPAAAAATKSSSQASAPPTAAAATKSSSQASAPPLASKSSSLASAPPVASKSSSQASAPPAAAAATKSSSQASAPPAAAAATKSSSLASAPPVASKSSSLASAPPVASKSSSQASAPPVASKSSSQTSESPAKVSWKPLTSEDAKERQPFFNRLYKSVAWKLVAVGGFSPNVNHAELLNSSIQSVKATLDVTFVPLKELADLPQNKSSHENIVCELRCKSVYLGTGCGKSKENAKAIASREALKLFLKKKVIVKICKRKYKGREIEDLVLLDEESKPSNLPPALRNPQETL
ncbi:CDKN2A-interacting protein [Platysternon megacephalum]|uniref:CDKN2A-interacting protein n=1 Tax=Platysternon megacephalum TaxID=55544 RepID=A0A4D9F988_9SAUR|nr:CDKN2A-interacting protein [Platysternon megacephalum]